MDPVRELDPPPARLAATTQIAVPAGALGD
jgi:hypothetical protein